MLGDRGVLATVEVKAARLPLLVAVEADECVVAARMASEIDAAACCVVREMLWEVVTI